MLACKTYILAFTSFYSLVCPTIHLLYDSDYASYQEISARRVSFDSINRRKCECRLDEGLAHSGHEFGACVRIPLTPLEKITERIWPREHDSICQRSEFLFIQLYRLLYMHFIVCAKLTTRER